ncbi:hypothetical protein D910_03359, partial [Dendroctonus ponderosae]
LYPNDLTDGLETLDSVWVYQLALADLRGIFALYESFRRFQKQQTGAGRVASPKQAWLDLTESILNDPQNAEVEGDMMCNIKQSPQQVLYSLYEAIALTELKGHAMIQFSYMLLRLYGKGNFTKESQHSRERFQERTNNAVESVKRAMQKVSRELWKCDPKKHVKGETYEEITNLLQGYVQNEVDLNPDGTCSENCAEYTYTKSHGCYQNLYCRQQRSCSGKIIDCRFFDSDMWICNANPLSGRRYEYIEYENGRVLGRKQGCARGTTKVDSWWRWLFWHCSYCFCLCDEQGPMSDRYFNMRSAISDIQNNKIITGLRFVKKNRVIHLQIQEGELLPRLGINASSVAWKPVEDYKITDRKIFNGQDYHTLTWEKRRIDLDDLEADDGNVLTGVRFKEIGSHLNFEIYTTRFNFETGKLTPELSKWLDNPNTDVSQPKPRDYLKQTLNGTRFKIAIEDLNYDVTNKKTGVLKAIERVNDLAYKDWESVNKKMNQMFEENYWCKNTKQSPQQVSYNLYNLVALAQLKAYVLQQFALLGNMLWDDSINYDTFTRLLQGHIQNEVDMNRRGTCRETCGAYSYATSHGCYDWKSDVCKKTERCYGDLHECFFVESHASICVSITADILTRLNQSKLRDQYLANIDHQLIWGGFASFIRCISALSGKDPILEKLYLAQQALQRSVAMKRSMETIYRQLQLNLLRIIHKDLNSRQWCISETTQLDYGCKNENIVVIYEFVAVTELRNEIIERIRTLLEWSPLGGYQNMRLPYKTRALFDKYSSFRVHKDIRICDPNKFILGIGFTVFKDVIHLKIGLHSFNADNGLLNSDQEVLMNEQQNRPFVPLSDMDVPSYTDRPSELMSFTPMFLNFTHTGFTQDMAQTTVPFLDSQEVTSNPAVPLTGAGLYYKALALAHIAIGENHLLVDKLRLDFIDLEDKLWKFVLWEAPTVDKTNAEFHVINRFSEFDQAMKQMPNDIFLGTKPLWNIHSFLFLHAEVEHTQRMYNKFREFLDDQLGNDPLIIGGKESKIQKPKIRAADLIRDILEPNNGANATVHKVYHLTFGEENMGLKVLNFLVNEGPCKNYSQSQQQIYYNLYNVIAFNGLKNYVMLQFAYLMSRISHKGNYTDLSEIVKVNFEKRVNETMSIFRGLMEVVPTATWNCDPEVHEKGQTYEEFTRLLQGHIENEVDMNNGGTCLQDCSAYSATKSYGCYDSDSKYCRENSSERRYDYIQYEEGSLLGKDKTCWRTPISSWWRWLVRCSYCLCLCDEQGPKSDRYISLRPVLSNIARNRVVTGLRFIKRNRVIHFQIQEGQLRPYGYIDNNTIRWVPVDDYKITEKGIYNNEDYFTMSNAQRSLVLDEVTVNDKDPQVNQVVTGIRFQFTEGKLRVQVRKNKFNWETGLISTSDGKYVSKAKEGMSKVDLSNADIPINLVSSKLYWEQDGYVEFTHTDFNLDAAQTTIPFIDIQPVINDPPVPLNGVGIYYKGNKGLGGFVAPKILTYDYSKFILVRFPIADVRHEAESLASI